MLKRLSIGKKLALISITLSVVLVGLVGVMLTELRQTMIEDRKVKLRSLVELAVNVINRYSQLEAAGKLSPEQARKDAVNALASFHFDGKNYFFIFDRNGVLVWHPTRKDDIGKNLLQDAKARTNYEAFLTATTSNPYLDGFSQIMAGCATSRSPSATARPGSKCSKHCRTANGTPLPCWRNTSSGRWGNWRRSLNPA